MPSITVDRVRVEWAQLRPQVSGLPELTVHAVTTNLEGDELPRTVRGYAGVSVARRNALAAALRDVLLDMTAARLGVAVSTLIVEGDTIRVGP